MNRSSTKDQRGSQCFTAYEVALIKERYANEGANHPETELDLKQESVADKARNLGISYEFYKKKVHDIEPQLHRLQLLKQQTQEKRAVQAAQTVEACVRELFLAKTELTTKELANRLGCHFNAIWFVLKRAGDVRISNRKNATGGYLWSLTPNARAHLMGHQVVMEKKPLETDDDDEWFSALQAEVAARKAKLNLARARV